MTCCRCRKNCVKKFKASPLGLFLSPSIIALVPQQYNKPICYNLCVCLLCLCLRGVTKFAILIMILNQNAFGSNGLLIKELNSSFTTDKKTIHNLSRTKLERATVQAGEGIYPEILRLKITSPKHKRKQIQGGIDYVLSSDIKHPHCYHLIHKISKLLLAKTMICPS